MKTTDTYKAAYFMTQGACLMDIEIKKAEPNKIMRSVTWVCILDGATSNMQDAWNTNNAVVNMSDLVRERNRIKKFAKRNRL